VGVKSIQVTKEYRLVAWGLPDQMDAVVFSKSYCSVSALLIERNLIVVQQDESFPDQGPCPGNVVKATNRALYPSQRITRTRVQTLYL
jgi:hypothetical protein